MNKFPSDPPKTLLTATRQELDDTEQSQGINPILQSHLERLEKSNSPVVVDSPDFCQLNFDDILLQTLGVPFYLKTQGCQSDSTASTMTSSDSTDCFVSSPKDVRPIENGKYRSGTVSKNSKNKKSPKQYQKTIITSYISAVLFMYFEMNSTPDKEERTQLANQLNVSAEQIGKWFRNHRYRARERERKEEEKIFPLGFPKKFL